MLRSPALRKTVRPLALATLLVASWACGEGRAIPPGQPGLATGDGGQTSQGDAGSAQADAVAIPQDATAIDDASGPHADAMSPGDAEPSLDAGGPMRDASAAFDAAPSSDAQVPLNPDATPPADASPPVGPDAAALPDAGPPSGSVNVTVSGCSADFGGDIVVGYNGSLGVASIRGINLAASLQFDLKGQTGEINLSTQHRIQSGVVVNLVTYTTWTNLSQDPDVISGQAPDPITGRLRVSRYEPEQGIADIELVGVTLENVSDHSHCTIDGTLHTTRLGR